MAEENEGAAEQEESTAGAGPKKKKLTMFIIIGSVLIVLIIAGGAGMFLLSGDSDSEEKKQDSTQTEEGGSSEKTEDSEKSKKEGGEQTGESTGESGKEESDAKEGSEDENFVDINFGATFNLKAFHLNLGNPLENRYLRLELAFEYKQGEEQRKEIQARLPQLRDAVISVASRKTREFLLGPDGKDQLRLEILNRVNQYMEKKIESVFITDLLIE